MMDSLLPWLVAAMLCVAVALWMVYDRHSAPRIRERARQVLRVRTREDKEARLTEWSGRSRGGIGVVEYPRGSVQAHYHRGVYCIEWFGRRGHPVGFEAFRSCDHAEFMERLSMWTARGHVHRQDHFRAGPMMAI